MKFGRGLGVADHAHSVSPIPLRTRIHETHPSTAALHRSLTGRGVGADGLQAKPKATAATPRTRLAFPCRCAIGAQTVTAYARQLRSLAAALTAAASPATLETAGTTSSPRGSPECRLADSPPLRIHQAGCAARGFYRYPPVTGQRSDNPAAELTTPGRRRHLPRPLAATLVDRVIAAAAGRGDPLGLRDHALVELLYGTGVWISEALDLQPVTSTPTNGSSWSPARAATPGSRRSSRPPCDAAGPPRPCRVVHVHVLLRFAEYLDTAGEG